MTIYTYAYICVYINIGIAQRLENDCNPYPPAYTTQGYAVTSKCGYAIRNNIAYSAQFSKRKKGTDNVISFSCNQKRKTDN